MELSYSRGSPLRPVCSFLTYPCLVLLPASIFPIYLFEEKLHMPSDDLSILHPLPLANPVSCHVGNSMSHMDPEFELPLVNSDA